MGWQAPLSALPWAFSRRSGRQVARRPPAGSNFLPELSWKLCGPRSPCWIRIYTCRVYVYTYLSTCLPLPTYLSTCLPVYLLTYLPTYLPTYLHRCIHICIHTHICEVYDHFEVYVRIYDTIAVFNIWDRGLGN